MSKAVLRPTIPSDLSAVIGEELPFRIRAITVLIDGEVKGVGGLAFPPNEIPWAFVQQSDDAKRYPVAFHRAGLAAMRMIEESGLSEVVATANADDEAALRWLKRLGFVEAREQNVKNKVVFFWVRMND